VDRFFGGDGGERASSSTPLDLDLRGLPSSFRFSEALDTGLSEWKLRSYRDDGAIERTGAGPPRGGADG